MIDACFERGARCGAISGLYQYDTGQRLRMLGLPAQKELGAKDGLNESGSMVQVHYAHEDDTQAEMRLAQYDEEAGAWVADVPDEYLLDSEPVRVYVYVSFGESEENERAETMYEGVFTPVRRPAPNNVASTEQWEAWEVLLGEVELAISDAQAAQEDALSDAEAAKEAAASLTLPTQEAQAADEEADTALETMRAMEAAWAATQISKVTLEPGSDPTISVSLLADGTRQIVLGIPEGADGVPGEKGDTGPADIQFSLDGTTLYTTTTT